MVQTVVTQTDITINEMVLLGTWYSVFRGTAHKYSQVCCLVGDRVKIGRFRSAKYLDKETGRGMVDFWELGDRGS